MKLGRWILPVFGVSLIIFGAIMSDPKTIGVISTISGIVGAYVGFILWTNEG